MVPVLAATGTAPFASLSARAALGAACWGELGWLYQSWAGARSYSPGLIDVARRQHTQLLRAMVSLPLSKEHGLFLEYRTGAQPGKHFPVCLSEPQRAAGLAVAVCPLAKRENHPGAITPDCL